MLGARGAIGQYAIGQFEAASGAYSVAGDVGTYVLTGQAAGLLRGLKVAAAVGEYTLSGQDVTLSRDRRLACYAGSYVVTGQDASVVSARILYATPYTRLGGTVYSFLGFAALGEVAIGDSQSDTISEPVNTYSTTGYDTILRRGVSMSADVGAYTVTGYDAGSYFTRVLTADVGAYVLSGQAAPSIINMGGTAGSYVLTGQDVTFNRVRKRIRGFARVGSSMTARAA